MKSKSEIIDKAYEQLLEVNCADPVRKNNETLEKPQC